MRLSGVRTMQERIHFRDETVVAILLEALRCREKGIKIWQDGYQLLISSGQMIDADEELQLSAAPWLWRNHHSSSTLLARPISISLPPQHNLLPLEPTRHSTLAPFASFVSECQNEAERTRLISTVQEILSVIQMDSSAVSRQDAVDQHNRLIIFCDEILPLQLFGAPCYTKDCIMSIGDTGWHSNDKKSSDKLSHSHNNTNNSKDLHHELVGWDKICNAKSLLKPCSAPGALFGRDQNVKRRKSVSFDDDVMVYLFDQESPTVELSSGPHAALPNSHLYNLPGVTTEDGLEWEDDFPAMERSCHFRCARQTASQPHTLTLPQQSSTALSRRLFLPQTCLFLTHVTESDLDL